MKHLGILHALLPLAGLASLLITACVSLTAAEREAYWATQVRSGFRQANPAAICHLHRVRTIPFVVPELSGMPVVPTDTTTIRYIKARLHRFPNSFWYVLSGSCVGPDSAVDRAICPVCRALERQWRRRHGWPADEKYPIPAALLEDDDETNAAAPNPGVQWTRCARH